MFYFFWFKKFDSMTIIFLNNSLSVSSHKHWVKSQVKKALKQFCRKTFPPDMSRLNRSTIKSFFTFRFMLINVLLKRGWKSKHTSNEPEPLISKAIHFALHQFITNEYNCDSKRRELEWVNACYGIHFFPFQHHYSWKILHWNVLLCTFYTVRSRVGAIQQ